MSIYRTIGFSLLLASTAALLMSATATKPATISYKVRAGESVSFICIKTYGHYDPAMIPEILQLNPAITDVNLISAEVPLILPAPITEAATTKAPAAPAKSSTTPAATPPQLFQKTTAIRQAVVTASAGDATLVSGNQRRPLLQNAIINPGDIITTGPTGRVEIVVNRESVVRVAPGTRITFTQSRDPVKSDTPTRFSLDGGTVWSSVKRMAATVNRFELTLPTAVAGVHGTVYQTTVGNDSTSLVKVYDGAVNVKNRPDDPALGGGLGEISGPTEIAGPTEVSMEAWTQIVRAMQQIRVSASGKPGAPESFAKKPADEWEKWNEERDQSAFELFGEKR